MTAAASVLTPGNLTEGPLLSVQDLTIGLRRGKGEVRIVEDISFDVDPGQRMGIVGESGSGKSLTLRAIAGLLPHGVEVLSGRVEYGGRDLLTMPAKTRRALMGPEIAMIFQEPMTALNPVMRVGDQIAEGPAAHLGYSRAAARRYAVERVHRPAAERDLDPQVLDVEDRLCAHSGRSRSASPSPISDRPRAVITTTTPGIVESSHFVVMKAWPSAIMPPQSGVGGWMPRPR